MKINSLVETGFGQNPIFPFATCGQLLRLELELSPGEPFREVTKIEWFDTCSGVITQVNGIPWANPLSFHINMTDDPDTNVSIDLVVNGGCSGVGIPFSGNFHIHYSGGSQNLYYTFIPIDPISPAFKPVPQYGGPDLQFFPCTGGDCSQLQPTAAILQNNTVGSLFVAVDFPLYTPGDVTFYLNGVEVLDPTNIEVPPGGDSLLQFTKCGGTWTPGFTVLNITICGAILALFLNVVPVQCGTNGLNLISSELKTESNFLPPVDVTDPLTRYDEAAIGEQKILRVVYQYNQQITGPDFDVYFNPWLFDIVSNFGVKYPSGIVDGPPPSGYFFKFNPNLGFSTFEMQIFNAGTSANSQRNENSYISFIDQNKFFIDFIFYMIEDLDDWIGTGTIANQPKLLNSHQSAPLPLENLVQSVYNVEKRLCFMTYVVDPNHPNEIPGSIPLAYEPNEAFFIKAIPFIAKFYNQGWNGSDPDWTNPQFALYRNMIQVDKLSILTPTELTFRIDLGVSGSEPVNNIVLWLIDTSQENNFAKFYDNYLSSRADIVTGGPGLINNQFIGPATGPTNVSGNVWEVIVNVDQGVNPEGIYRAVAVVYADSNSKVFSYISDEILVTRIPGIEICCPLSFNSEWWNYFRQIGTNCAIPTVKERVSHRLEVNGGDFSLCLVNYGAPAIWYEYLTNVRLNVYRYVPDFPSVGKTTFFMFDQYQSIKTPGFPGSFNNLSPDFTAGINGFGNLDLFWSGRVRYEEDLPLSGSNVFVANSPTSYSRLPAGPLGSTYVNTIGVNYNWGDENIIFEYQFEFDLSSIFGEAFNLVLNSSYSLTPVDVEPSTAPFDSLFRPLRLDGNGTTEIEGPFCEGSFDFIEVNVFKNTPPISYRGHLLATVESFPYGINNIQEEDGVLAENPSSGLPALHYPRLYNLPVTFNDNGSFNFNIQGLSPGKYLICAILLNDPT
jgi:hypothetical protein